MSFEPSSPILGDFAFDHQPPVSWQICRSQGPSLQVWWEILIRCYLTHNHINFFLPEFISHEYTIYTVYSYRLSLTRLVLRLPGPFQSQGHQSSISDARPRVWPHCHGRQESTIPMDQSSRHPSTGHCSKYIHEIIIIAFVSATFRVETLIGPQCLAVHCTSSMRQQSIATYTTLQPKAKVVLKSRENFPKLQFP